MTNNHGKDDDEDETVLIRHGKGGQPRYIDARFSEVERSEQMAVARRVEAGERSRTVDPFETILHGEGWQTEEDGSDATQILKPKRNSASEQASSSWASDPIVAMLLVISGPGKGAYRPLFYGNNSLGRSPKERVPLNFGDDTISNTEQLYIRYDHEDRQFILIPNLAKSNIVAVNEEKPTGPVLLPSGSIIKMGNTQLLFYPICGPNFDWSDLEDQ